MKEIILVFLIVGGLGFISHKYQQEQKRIEARIEEMTIECRRYNLDNTEFRKVDGINYPVTELEECIINGL